MKTPDFLFFEMGNRRIPPFIVIFAAFGAFIWLRDCFVLVGRLPFGARRRLEMCSNGLDQSQYSRRSRQTPKRRLEMCSNAPGAIPPSASPRLARLASPGTGAIGPNRYCSRQHARPRRARRRLRRGVGMTLRRCYFTFPQRPSDVPRLDPPRKLSRRE